MGVYSTVIGDGLYRVETRTHQPQPGDVITELNVFSISQEEALLRTGRSPRMARAGAHAVQAQLLDAEVEDLLVFVSQLAARHGRERRAALRELLDLRLAENLPSVQELVDTIEATTPEDPEEEA